MKGSGILLLFQNYLSSLDLEHTSYFASGPYDRRSEFFVQGTNHFQKSLSEAPSMLEHLTYQLQRFSSKIVSHDDKLNNSC